MPGGEERSLSLRLALVGAGSALLGSVIGVMGSVAVAGQQADREDENRLRDRREALYVRLLEYQREVMYGEEEDRIATALERLDALNTGKPLPSPTPTPDERSDLAEAERLVQRAVAASLEHRELTAEVEVYASIEVAKLFSDFYSAQTDEVVAVAEAAAGEDDDDTAAERRRDRAEQAQAQANLELAQQVRREVADV